MHDQAKTPQDRQSGLEDLFSVAEASVAAYGAAAEQMVSRVNASLLGHSDVSDLLGPCPVDMMHDNHRNHARFMLTVFDLNLPGLLRRVVPWVYRAYISRGFSPDYFPAELRAWKEAVGKHVPEAEAQPIQEVYQWMLDQHENMLELARTQEGGIAPPETWTDSNAALLRMLLAGDRHGAEEVVGNRLNRPDDLSEVYLGMVQPVMYRIGGLWERAEISVAQEHLATAIASRLMTLAYRQVAVFNGKRGKAIVTAAASELHELGPRIVADLLELAGWDVTFLGANMPTEEVRTVAAEMRPDFVAASATLPYHLRGVRDIARAMRETPELSDTPLLAGGLAFSLAPEAKEAVGADAVARDADQAVQLAGQLTRS